MLRYFELGPGLASRKQLDRIGAPFCLWDENHIVFTKLRLRLLNQGISLPNLVHIHIQSIPVIRFVCLFAGLTTRNTGRPF